MMGPITVLLYTSQWKFYAPNIHHTALNLKIHHFHTFASLPDRICGGDAICALNAWVKDTLPHLAAMKYSLLAVVLTSLVASYALSYTQPTLYSLATLCKSGVGEIETSQAVDMCEVFAGHLTFDDPETFLSCTYVQGSAILSYGCQLAGLRRLTADVACLLHMGTALWACELIKA